MHDRWHDLDHSTIVCLTILWEFCPPSRTASSLKVITRLFLHSCILAVSLAIVAKVFRFVVDVVNF